MSRWIAIVVALGAFAIIAFSFSGPIRNCCGARPEPSATEAKLARSLHALSIPGEARDARNPFSANPEILQEARRHFADHCASCHANDGSGNTEMGRNLYPRSPDMRQAATQQLTDGELYYIIHNGIRWTGMPAWGSTDNDPDSWKLVLFVRHLPDLTPVELHDMEQHNPQSPAELEEQQQEEKFLNGETK
ncbi:MAG TPA: c-type cytochrome [Terriglobales bacterium]|jgi:mono/diheme cytochrome c family protein|nr:c-type cytochrome [Terriglobales bacterium]